MNATCPTEQALNEMFNPHTPRTKGKIMTNKKKLRFPINYIVPVVDVDKALRLAKAAPALLAALKQAVGFLAESHQDEIDRKHYGDKTGSCSYCRAIAEAHAAIEATKGGAL